MAKGIIGQPFTFTVLFVDSSGQPITPNTVTIEVFYFDSTGAKQTLAAATTVMSAVTGDPGRYKYTITIPSSLTVADQIYGVMTGTITSTGEEIVVEETVDPFEVGGGGGGGTTIIAQYDGVLVGTFSTLNFIGADVELEADGNTLKIYIPPPPPPPPSSFQSHWNTSDGDNGNQSVSDGLTRKTTRISTPNGGEGIPFKTGGWAGSNRATTRSTSVTITTPSTTTGWGGDSYYVVNVFDADGTTVLQTYTSPAITGNFSNTTGNITSSITNFAVDAGNGIDLDRNKAKLSVTVDLSTLLPNGGRYNCQVVMYTDTTSDGTGPYTYTQPAIFIDTNPTAASISGTLSFSETPGIVTKYLSGVRYYTIGSEFTVGVTGIDNLNNNTIRTSNNLTITPSGYILPTLNLEPFNDAGFTGWTNDNNNTGTAYNKTNWQITDPNERFTATNASVSALVRDPWTDSATLTSNLSNIIVDTYSGNSGDTVEYFNDESRRQDSGYNSGNPNGNWVSTTTLTSGQALVFGGKVQIPSSISSPNLTIFSPGPNPDYSSLSAASSYYRTYIDNPPPGSSERTGCTISLAGTFIVDATTDLANSHIKIFIRRRNSTSSSANTGPTSPPLRVHGPLYDFNNFNDGATVIGSYIRKSTSSGNQIEATFGGALFNCTTGVFVELQIVSSSISISSFNISFN